MPVFLLCTLGTAILWLLEPPAVKVPAEIEALSAPQLDLQLEFPVVEETPAVDPVAGDQISADEDVEVTGLISPTDGDSTLDSDSQRTEYNESRVFWAFPEIGGEQRETGVPRLMQLPTIEEPSAEAEFTAEADEADEALLMEFPPLDDEPLEEGVRTEEETLAESEPAEDDAESEEPIAVLLPPIEIPTTEFFPGKGVLAAELPAGPSDPVESLPGAESVPTRDEPITPTPNSFVGLEHRLIEQVIRETSQGATGALTNSRLDEVATKKIHQANALARRGAPFAARQRLIEVLRMVSQAKDAQSEQSQYTTALAAGLRGLEEAEDFMPQGAQLEADLDVGLVVGAHRTPLAQHVDLATAQPHEMLDRYLRYAQLKLAMSVAGDPAGSMALYALGKVASQVGETEKPRDRLTHRQAVAYQQAALLAHNQNHYAAHELAVLLAESGHYKSARHLLLQVASRQPNSMVFRNLARVETKLGMAAQARASHEHSRKLSTVAPGKSNLIDWVPPHEFNRGSAPVHESQHSIARQPSSAVQR